MDMPLLNRHPGPVQSCGTWCSSGDPIFPVMKPKRHPITAGLALATGALGAATLPGVASASLHPQTSGPTLVIYSAQGYDSAETTAFQKATGIKVLLDDDSTGPLLTKVEAEKNNPKWGLLWVDGATAFASLDQQHLLMRGWEPSVQWNNLGQAAVPADKSYVPTGLTMAGTLVYNSKIVKHPPTTWQQLLQPQWNGQVGMNDPAVSGPTYPFVAGMMSYLGGTSKGENYYKDLQKNGLHVHLTNGDTLAALEAGIIKLALIQSSAGIGAGLKTSGSVKTEFLKPVTALPSAIGIDAKAPKAEQAEAEQFVEFVLSAQGQKVMQSGDPTGDSLYWPVLKGVNPLPALPPLSKVPAQTINPYLWGAQENTVNTWFTDTIIS
jgi:iron(III) transport system substrate-binding protein